MPMNTGNGLDTYKKGDFLVDYGQVFKIVRVDKIKTDQGSDQLLVFRPFFKIDSESEVTSSLPVKNLDRTTIRKPLTKKELDEVLAILSDKKIKLEIVDVLTAKAILNLNEPRQVAETIRKLFLEKTDLELKFTSSKKYVYRLLISRLAEEVALAYNISTEKAEIKVETKLK